jgi:thymidylate synthase
MNNERYNQIIDDAYKNYEKICMEEVNSHDVSPPMFLYPMWEKDFINKIKTDKDFSERWGLKIEERELSYDERFRLYVKRDKPAYPLNVENINEYLTLIEIPTRAISLMWNQRSCDLFLGIPFNIASYGLLLEIIAKAVNMVPDELIGNLGDVHLYSNHIEQAKEQIGREPYPLPTLKHLRNDDKYKLLCEFPLLWDELKISDFEIENYQSHLAIKAPLSN